jgi:hypothetical protein
MINPDGARIFICPECLQGKHQNCDRTTLNEEDDLIVECECDHDKR